MKRPRGPWRDKLARPHRGRDERAPLGKRSLRCRLTSRWICRRFAVPLLGIYSLITVLPPCFSASQAPAMTFGKLVLLFSSPPSSKETEDTIRSVAAPLARRPGRRPLQPFRHSSAALLSVAQAMAAGKPVLLFTSPSLKEESEEDTAKFLIPPFLRRA